WPRRNAFCAGLACRSRASPRRSGLHASGGRTARPAAARLRMMEVAGGMAEVAATGGGGALWLAVPTAACLRGGGVARRLRATNTAGDADAGVVGGALRGGRVRALGIGATDAADAQLIAAELAGWAPRDAGITRAADEALVAGAGPALQGAATAVTPRPAGRPLRRAGGRLAATTVLLLVLLMLRFGRGRT